MYCPDNGQTNMVKYFVVNDRRSFQYRLRPVRERTIKCNINKILDGDIMAREKCCQFNKKNDTNLILFLIKYVNSILNSVTSVMLVAYLQALSNY